MDAHKRKIRVSLEMERPGQLNLDWKSVEIDHGLTRQAVLVKGE